MEKELSNTLGVKSAKSEPRAGSCWKAGIFEGWNVETAPPPLFFVSVASKGVGFAASLLFATLAGRFIRVAAKGLMGTRCWRESNGLGW
jgi:hypothetical protein